MSTSFLSTNPLGARLRKLRQERKLPLRKVAALLDMDVAILSKMERGQRKLTKEVVMKLAEIYGMNSEELIIQFLSEKIIEAIGDDDLAPKVIKAADAQVEYAIARRLDPVTIQKLFHPYFEKDQRIQAAWLFGSFARGDITGSSDIDIMVRLDKSMRITLFDLAEIVYDLEQIAGRKVDLVEEGSLKSFAVASAERDKIMIYG